MEYEIPVLLYNLYILTFSADINTHLVQSNLGNLDEETIWYIIFHLSWSQYLEFFLSFIFISISPLLLIQFISLINMNTSFFDRLRTLYHQNDLEWRAEFQESIYYGQRIKSD